MICDLDAGGARALRACGLLAPGRKAKVLLTLRCDRPPRAPRKAGLPFGRPLSPGARLWMRHAGAPGRLSPAFRIALALRLDALVSICSDIDGGDQRLSGLPKAVSAAPIDLPAQISAETAFRQIALSCLCHYRQNVGLLLRADRTEAVHQARVDRRRLRSAFAIFSGLIRSDGCGRLRGELRWLASVLGDARDIDVLLARTAPELNIHGQLRRLMLDLVEWLTIGDWRHAPETAAARAVAARFCRPSVVALVPQAAQGWLRSGGAGL